MPSFNDPSEWVPITLYTADSDSQNQAYPKKAWCMFKNPTTNEWMSGFGKWSSSVDPSQGGLVGRLTIMPVQSKGPYPEMSRALEKKRKGYTKDGSQLGFYISLRSREVIDLDYAPERIVRMIKGQRPTDQAIDDSGSHEPKSKRTAIADAFARINAGNAPGWF